MNPGDEHLQPRSSTARLALLMRVIVAGFAVVVVAFRYGLIVAALSALCGGLLVVVARRRKAQPVPGGFVERIGRPAAERQTGAWAALCPAKRSHLDGQQMQRPWGLGQHPSRP